MPPKSDKPKTDKQLAALERQRKAAANLRSRYGKAPVGIISSFVKSRGEGRSNESFFADLNASGKMGAVTSVAPRAAALSTIPETNSSMVNRDPSPPPSTMVSVVPAIVPAVPLSAAKVSGHVNAGRKGVTSEKGQAWQRNRTAALSALRNAFSTAGITGKPTVQNATRYASALRLNATAPTTSTMKPSNQYLSTLLDERRGNEIASANKPKRSRTKRNNGASKVDKCIQKCHEKYGNATRNNRRNNNRRNNNRRTANRRNNNRRTANRRNNTTQRNNITSLRIRAPMTPVQNTFSTIPKNTGRSPNILNISQEELENMGSVKNTPPY
jgi:hypothetical protein